MLICKHFNISWLDLQKSITLSKYYVMLAIALDEEELARYRWWINSNQDPKKFPWSSKDHAGTKTLKDTPFGKILSLANKMGGIRRGSPLEYIRATNSRYVFLDKFGNFYDKDKNPIDFDFRARENSKVVVLRLEEYGEKL